MDDKSKKQLRVILLLLPVLVLILGKNVLAPLFVHRATPPATAANKVVTPSAATKAPSVEAPVIAPPGRDAAVKALEDRPWGRNPFQVEKPTAAPVAPRPNGVIQVPQNTLTKGPLFKLEGIVWDERNPYAIINGELRVVGDQVFGYEIVGIKEDRVTLRKDGQNIDLRLFPDMR